MGGDQKSPKPRPLDQHKSCPLAYLRATKSTAYQGFHANDPLRVSYTSSSSSLSAPLFSWALKRKVRISVVGNLHGHFGER